MPWPILTVLTFFFFLSACKKTTLLEIEESRLEVKEIPSDYLFQQRAYPYGKIDQNSYRRARLNKKQTMQLRSGAPTFAQSWQLRGPSNIGGRITAIEMPTTDQQTIYAGSASGGIFKSTDQGHTFNPIFDNAGSLSIGDLAIAPQDPNIIFVGTGEANAGGSSLAYDGDGVYKSTDAGRNWTSVGLLDAGSIGRIKISHQDPNVVYVAAMGHLFSNTGQRGIFKTEDGGKNWEQVLFLSDSTGGIDLAIHPENHNIIYAAMWERIRRPYNRQYGGATSGVYRSIDGGQSWTEMTNGLPAEASEKGRIGLALAPSQPDMVYAYYVDSIGRLQGVYRTEDAGDSWQTRSVSGIRGVSFGWWFGRITVHPQDPEIIYLTNLNMHRSVNGGLTWNNIFSGVHVDQHALFIHPANPDLVINGNDGGIYISSDKGFNYRKVSELPNMQFYSCKIDPNDPNRLYGGTQDNGTNRTTTGSEDDWNNLTGGDGFGVNITPDNSSLFYTQVQNGVILRTEDDGESFINISFDNFGGPFNWNTPLKLDPFDSRILYSGNQRLFRSTDRGDNWTPISPSLVNSVNPQGNLTFGTLTSIDVSPLNSEVIYVGTDDGNVWVSKNYGANWQSIQTGIPQRWITRITASPHQVETVYLTVSGFRFGESEAQVFRSDDQGANWVPIGASLPDVPVNDIIVDSLIPERLYLATDIGVYYSINDGDNWELLGIDLPEAPVTDLDFHVHSRTLAAATYGRSMYTYDLSLSTNAANIMLKNQIVVYPNPSRGQFTLESKSSNFKINKIELFDVSGKRVYKKELIEAPTQLQKLSLDLAPGIYSLSVQSSKGQISNEKIVFQ